MVTQNFEFLWILDLQGNIYVQRSFDRSLTTQIKDMYSCLLSSLTMFSSNVFNTSCDKFCVGNKTVVMKSYPQFQVVLSVNEAGNDVKSLVEEVGEAFRVQYEDYLKTNPTPDSAYFTEFGSIIDMIFGIKTYVYLEEQDQLLKILDEAIANNHPESITIKRILDFLDNLTDYKLELLINNIGDNLKLILGNAKGLSSLQKNRYKKII